MNRINRLQGNFCQKLFLGLVFALGAAFGQERITINPTPTGTGVIVYRELNANGANAVITRAPNALAGDVNVTWPVTPGNYTYTFKELDNSFTTRQTLLGANLRQYRATEFADGDIEFASQATPMSGNWTVGVGDSLVFPGTESAFRIKYQGTQVFSIENNGDVVMPGALSVTGAIGAASANVGGLLVGTIRTNDFSSVLIFDKTTRNLTNINGIAMNGALTGVTSCTGAGCGASLSANNIFTGTDAFDRGVFLKSNSPGFPPSNPSSGYGGFTHFIGSIYQFWNGTAWATVDLANANLTSSAPISIVSRDIRCTTCFLTTGGQTVAGTSTFDQITANDIGAVNSIGATTVSASTLRVTQIRFGGLSNTLLFDGNTGNITNVNALAMNGALTGVTSCTGAGCGAPPSSNNVFTGTDSFDKGIFLKSNSPGFPPSNPGAGYGGLSHFTGSIYQYWNGSAWASADLSNINFTASSPITIVSHDIRCPNCFLTTGGQTVAGTSTFGDINAANIAATTVGATSMNASTVALTQIRFGGLSNTLLFDGNTANITNVHNITLNGTVTGATNLIVSVTATSPIVSSGGTSPVISCSLCLLTSGGQTISGTDTFNNLTTTGSLVVTANDLRLFRPAGTFQSIFYDENSGTANDWTAGVKDSVTVPASGSSAYIITNAGVNRMVIDVGGDTTFSSALNAASMNAATGVFTTARVGQLRYSGFANTLLIDGSTGDFFAHNVTISGTCSGCPGATLPITVTGTNGSGGIVAEASNQLVEWGMNDVRFGTQVNGAQGGFNRADSRAGEILFQWWGRPAASSTTTLQMALSSAGRLDVNGSTDQLTWLTAASGFSTYLEMGPAGVWTEFQTAANGNFGFGHFGITANVFQSIQANAKLRTLVLDNGFAQMRNVLVYEASGTQPTFEMRSENAAANLFITNYTGAGSFVGQAARGTIAAPLAVNTNTQLAMFSARGYQGVAGSGGGFTGAPSAAITMAAAEGWDATHQGAYITFSTVASGGSTTRVEVLRVGSTGQFNSVQATNAGFYTNLGFTTDQAIYLKDFGSATMNAPGAGYGALAHQSGSTYWYWNGSSYASVNFAASAAVCGSNQQIQYNNFGSCGASSALTFDGTFLFANTLRLRGNDAVQIYESLASTPLKLSTASGNIVLEPTFSSGKGMTLTPSSGIIIPGNQFMVFDKSASSSFVYVNFRYLGSSDWIVGSQDSIDLPGSGQAAFVIKNNSTLFMRMEQTTGVTTFTGGVTANTLGANSGSFSDVTTTQIHEGSFSHLLIFDGSTRNLTNLNNITAAGTINFGSLSGPTNGGGSLCFFNTSGTICRVSTSGGGINIANNSGTALIAMNATTGTITGTHFAVMGGGSGANIGLSCPSGQAIKTLFVSEGLVTGATCAAP